MRERAEPDAFLAFRPWLLVLAVCAGVLVSGRRRVWMALLALFILAATAGEWAVTAVAGAPDAAVMVRAVAASLVLVLAIAGSAAGLYALFQRRWAAAAATLMFWAGVLALRPPLPSPMMWFEHGIRPAASVAAPSGGLPRALLLTDLPLIWGEGTPEAMLNGEAGPPGTYAALREAAVVTPIDAIEEITLEGAAVLILAQPRALHPAELVRIDDWVRGGGRALILADPALHWAEDLAAATRRPPARSLIGPLLAHWGLSFADVRPGFHMVSGDTLFGAGRIGVRDAGVLESTGANCRIVAEGLMADCLIGKGRGLVVADADLLSDAVWTGPGPLGATRAGRFADNGLFVRGAVRTLAGGPMPSDPAEQVRWMTLPPPDHKRLMAIGLSVPLILTLIAGGIATRLRNPR